MTLLATHVETYVDSDEAYEQIYIELYLLLMSTSSSLSNIS
jgi:hypothetical protein